MKIFYVVRVRGTKANVRFGFFVHLTMGGVGVGITKTLRGRNLTFTFVRLTRTTWTFFRFFFCLTSRFGDKQAAGKIPSKSINSKWSKKYRQSESFRDDTRSPRVNRENFISGSSKIFPINGVLPYQGRSIIKCFQIDIFIPFHYYILKV